MGSQEKKKRINSKSGGDYHLNHFQMKRYRKTYKNYQDFFDIQNCLIEALIYTNNFYQLKMYRKFSHKMSWTCEDLIGCPCAGNF